MKLLIVDDEDLTREGLVSSIDWSSLNINYIYQADDGLNALALIRKYKPEIILSDIRMPRMNGIEMAEKIREIAPDSSIIFMSGYSDKEYLKSAIKLKAIRYVEKPIDTDEVIEAVKEAIAHFELSELNKNSQYLRRQELANKLAYQLLYPMEDSVFVSDSLKQLEIPVSPSSHITTVMVKFTESIANIKKLSLEESLADLPFSYTLHGKKEIIFPLYTTKQDEYLILHLISPDIIPEISLSRFLSSLAEKLNPLCRYFIAVGRNVTGIEKTPVSYESALLLLQSSFFYDYNSIILPSEKPMGTQLSEDTQNVLACFTESLSNKDKEKVYDCIHKLYQSFKGSQNVLANHIKDLYYKLFIAMNDTALSFHIHLHTDDSVYSIWDSISGSNTLTELHALLLDRLDQFFRMCENSMEENSTVFMIKDYISRNYANESLSVKDISEHVFLSSSYVCTLFKSETGQTLNQYLTDYRIEKAKKLLQDPRYKITDISEKVGYTDGNYFGKTFKRTVGLSPSEYREKYKP